MAINEVTNDYGLFIKHFLTVTFDCLLCGIGKIEYLLDLIPLFIITMTFLAGECLIKIPLLAVTI